MPFYLCIYLKIFKLKGFSETTFYWSSLLTDKVQTPWQKQNTRQVTLYFHTLGNPICLSGKPFVTFIIWLTPWISFCKPFNWLLEIELIPHFKAVPAQCGQDTLYINHPIITPSPPHLTQIKFLMAHHYDHSLAHNLNIFAPLILAWLNHKHGSILFSVDAWSITF